MLSRMMTRREQLLLFGAGLAFVLGSLSLYLHHEVWKTPSPETSSPAAPSASATGNKPATPPSKGQPVHATGTAEGEGEPQWITVKDVVEPVVGVAAMGEVYQPGFYYMAEDARVIDLLERAGGATGDADLDALNLVAPLIDGTTLTVPPREQRHTEKGEVRYLRIRQNKMLNPPSYLR